MSLILTCAKCNTRFDVYKSGCTTCYRPLKEKPPRHPLCGYVEALLEKAVDIKLECREMTTPRFTSSPLFGREYIVDHLQIATRLEMPF